MGLYVSKCISLYVRLPFVIRTVILKVAVEFADRYSSLQLVRYSSLQYSSPNYSMPSHALLQVVVPMLNRTYRGLVVFSTITMRSLPMIYDDVKLQPTVLQLEELVISSLVM